MKNSISVKLKKSYEVLYASFMGAGFLLLADSFFKLSFHPILTVLLTVLIQILICWSEEKKIRIQVWGTGAALAAAYGFFLYQTQRDLAHYVLFLELLAASAGAGILCYAARRRLWMKGPFMLAQFCCLILLGIEGIDMPKWSVAMILLCSLLALAEGVEWKAGRKAGEHALYLFPVFFISMMLLACMPVKNTPIQWETVKNIAEAVSEKIGALIVNVQYWWDGSGDRYAMSFAGYQEDGTLGGELMASDKLQISLEGYQTKTPLYLSGSVYNSYDGSRWERNADQKDYTGKEYEMRYEELCTALEHSVYPEEETKKLLSFGSCSIKFEGLKTASLFTAPWTRKVTVPAGTKLEKEPGDGFVLSRPKSVGFSYGVQFMEVDYGNEKMQKLMRQEAWKNKPAPEGEMAKRQAFIYENYTKLPKELPKRVYSLAEEITAKADTDYDRMKAIESYLNQYTYSASPEICPKGQDFTDFFLFESRTGYCTYFATAMAVLGRCEGIPTRYVEGFVTKESCTAADHETCTLSGENAHAWMEAYISNVGWIPFEPTPGYQESVGKAWEQPVETDEYTSTVPGRPEENKMTEVLQAQAAEKANRDFWKQGIRVLKLLAEILLVVAAMAGIAVLFFWGRRMLRKKSYEKRNGLEKLEAQMQKIFWFGKLYGIEREPGEILSEYGMRLEGHLDTPERSFERICTLFESVRFGGRSVEETDLKELEQYVELLERQYLKSCGRMQKLWYYVSF